jgi:DNA polymerase I-like protein with 3'-5' exonuclease and polymerase domains
VVKDTNESTLLAADDGRIIPAILDFRSKEKSAQQAQTLLDAIASDGRIHSHFDPTGTDTGRFASRSPNLQNIARGRLRSCFVAGPGRSLITADYSQIELRAAAAIAGENEMIEAYRGKIDLHRKTAAAIVGSSEISAEDRQIAKSANFGLLYGQGTQGLVSYARTAYGVTLTVEQALAIRNRFFSTYPELARWHADCWKAASEKAGEARTRLGRRRLIAPGADRWHRFTALVNSPVQGGCADGIKLAMLALSKALPENAKIVSTVHDELVIECDTDQAADLAAIVSETMTSAMSGLFPEVPIEVETSIGNAWSKS